MEIEVISNSNLDKVINSIRPAKYDSISYRFCVSGDYLRFANKHKESIPQYLQAIMKDRNNIDAYIGIAHSYKAVGNYTKAVNYYTNANNLEPSYELFLELGMCNFAMEKYDEALKNFMSAIKLSPDNLDAQTWLALTHEELEEYSMAFLIYDNIIEHHPEYLNAYINKGTLEMSIDQYQEATNTFSQVIKINPNFYKAYFGIALCFDKMGMFKDAKRYYTKFLNIKPQADVAEFVRARINKISVLKRPRCSHLSLVN